MALQRAFQQRNRHSAWTWLTKSCPFIQPAVRSRLEPLHVHIVHILFSWRSFPIGQECSQALCRPYLAANFGFFELWTFPWSPSWVDVGAFYLFTLKIGSKYTYIILESSSAKPPVNFFCCKRRDLLCHHNIGDLFTLEDIMLFSHVQILCLRAKAHLIFHWCLCNKLFNLITHAFN